MDNRMTPIQREAVIKAMATGDMETLKAIRNEIRFSKSGQKRIRINGMLDFMKVASRERKARENEETFIGDPEVIIEVSPVMQRLQECMVTKHSLGRIDIQDLSKIDSKHHLT